MTENYTEHHHKVKKLYFELFKDKTVSNKKNELRHILEIILKRLLSKYCNATQYDFDKGKYRYMNQKYNKLIKENRLHIKYKSALEFLREEGNMGSHSNTRTDDAGEESYIDALVICIKPIIKDFFEDEGFNTDFLDTQQTNDVIVSKNKSLKKNLILPITSTVLGVFLVFSLIYMFFIHRDIKSKEANIESLSDTQKQFKEDLKRKNYTIDSLKKVVLITESKQEKNYGFKNEFKGNVGTVNNIDKVKNLDDLD